MKAIHVGVHSVVLARLLVCSLTIASIAACTNAGDPKPDAVAIQLEPGKTAASLQLQAVAEQLQGSEVADVAALEAKINDPEAGLNAVDIDEDGVIDFVQVVEKQKGDKTILVLQAIPSSKKGEKVSKIAVEVARIELDVKKADPKNGGKVIVVHATYTEHIQHDPEVHVYHEEIPVVVEHGELVLVEGCFFHHVFVVEHDVYHGHHGDVVIEVYDDHHHDYKHQKHKKHKKGKHHGHDGVVITW